MLDDEELLSLARSLFKTGDHLEWLLKRPTYPPSYDGAADQRMYRWYLKCVNGDYNLFATTYVIWKILAGDAQRKSNCALGAYHLGLAAISHGAYGEAFQIGEFLKDYGANASEDEMARLIGPSPSATRPPILSKESMVADALRLMATASAIGNISSRDKADSQFIDLYEHLERHIHSMPDHRMQRHQADREVLRFACRRAINLASPGRIHHLGVLLPSAIGGQPVTKLGLNYIERVGHPNRWVTFSPLDLDTAARIALLVSPKDAANLIGKSKDQFNNIARKNSVDKRCNALVQAGMLVTEILYYLTEDEPGPAFRTWLSLHRLCGDESRLKHSRWAFRTLMRFEACRVLQ